MPGAIQAYSAGNNGAAPVPAAQRSIETITGIVMDTDGEPLPGATVRFKDAKIGTVTDVNGCFTLTNNTDVRNNPQLVVSYVGMATQTIPAIAGKDMEIVMVSNTSNLDEVVVIY